MAKKEGAEPAPLDNSVGPEAGRELLAIIERIERINEEIKTYNDDKKEIYAESKSRGFDNKIIKKIVSLRAIDAAERQETDAMLDVYMQAIGMK